MAQWANYHNRDEKDPAWEPDHFIGLKQYQENVKAKISAFRGMLHSVGGRKVR